MPGGNKKVTHTFHIKKKPYAFTLASDKLSLSVSNVLDRSINILPTFLPLSRRCFHFSIAFSKTFCVLWFLPNPVNSGENVDSFKKKKNFLVGNYSFKYIGCVGKNNNSAIFDEIWRSFFWHVNLGAPPSSFVFQALVPPKMQYVNLEFIIVP